MNARTDFAAQLACIPEAFGLLLAFVYSQVSGVAYREVRVGFCLDESESASVADALILALDAGDAHAAGAAFFLAILTAAQIFRLDSVLILESAASLDSSAASVSLVAGLAFIFAPALILFASIFVFGKRRIRGK